MGISLLFSNPPPFSAKFEASVDSPDCMSSLLSDASSVGEGDLTEKKVVGQAQKE